VSTSRRGSFLAVVGSGATVVIATVVLTLLNGRAENSDSTTRESERVVHSDHATYGALNDLAGGSSVIIAGTVTGSRPGVSIPGASGGPAVASDIPQTDFAVRVDRTFKGRLAAGGTVTVTVIGGSSGVGTVVQEGVPSLSLGQQYVFFLSAGDDTKFYPLAGGAAIAGKGADGSFSLPSEVGVNSTVLSFTTAQLASVPAPDRVLVMLTSAPLDRTEGDVQSGIVSIGYANGTPVGMSGTALIDGRIVSLAITMNGRSTAGSFTLDDVTYTLQPGAVVVPGRDRSVAINGQVQGPSGVQQFRLQVFDR
jgi:hypothetical protein